MTITDVGVANLSEVEFEPGLTGNQLGETPLGNTVQRILQRECQSGEHILLDCGCCGRSSWEKKMFRTAHTAECDWKLEKEKLGLLFFSYLQI